MNAIGIVAEYNPFHTGHKHQLDLLSKSHPDHIKVALMSGNFVQRGEPAFLEKYARARAACKNGADVVFELPFPFSILPAELFARAAVSIFTRLNGVSALSFGAENAVAKELVTAAKNLLSEEFETALSSKLKDGSQSYPRVRSKVYEELYKDASIISQPNNILAIEYIKSSLMLNSHLDFIPVQRAGADYNSLALDEEFASSGALRKSILTNGRMPEKFLPAASIQSIDYERSQGRFPISCNNFESLVMFSLLGKSKAQLASFFDTAPLSGKIYHSVRKAKGLCELYSLISSKSFTSARIHRAILYCLLGVRLTQAKSKPYYVNLLACNERGKNFISLQRSNKKITVITKPAHGKQLSGKAKEQFEKASYADDVFSLLYPIKSCFGTSIASSPYIEKGDKNVFNKDL